MRISVAAGPVVVVAALVVVLVALTVPLWLLVRRLRAAQRCSTAEAEHARRSDEEQTARRRAELDRREERREERPAGELRRLRAQEDELAERSAELERTRGEARCATGSRTGRTCSGALVESAHLAGMMAAELGVDPEPVRRSALLHGLG